MSMVSDLFIRCTFWEDIVPYIFPDSKLQFCSLSRLTSHYFNLDLGNVNKSSSELPKTRISQLVDTE
ncbi:unnamed protein product [Brassica rapa subsp. trilocularis]